MKSVRTGRRSVFIAAMLPCACLLAAPVLAQTIGGGTCNPSNLSGTYSLVLNGRGISAAGNFSGSFQSNGTATFDGKGSVALAGTFNTNTASGQAFQYAGTYTVPSNCYGTLKLTQGSGAIFTLLVWNGGAQFILTGMDANYIYSGSGGNTNPVACGTATLSGPFSYDATGFTLFGTEQTGSANEAGVFQFDGQGHVTASYTIAGPNATSVTSTGSYSVAPDCGATATLQDSTGKSNSLNLVITGIYGQNFDLIEANPSFVRSGSGHSAFSNPTQSIANVASYAVNATPPGSVFYLAGVNLSSKPSQAGSAPLPPTLLSTSVTVNGEPAPLFYVDSDQIDAQMPWNIPGNSIATVIVKNGNAASNAAAVYVPATATPGISVFSTNRAVVVNKDNITVNTAASPASVGDEVVVYFTGGGPVAASGNLVTGAAAPGGFSPVSGSNPSVTVGAYQAPVVYMGLTPGAIGLYQANFIVPQLAKGTYPVVITIDGQPSNKLGGPVPNPVMTVGN